MIIMQKLKVVCMNCCHCVGWFVLGACMEIMHACKCTCMWAVPRSPWIRVATVHLLPYFFSLLSEWGQGSRQKKLRSSRNLFASCSWVRNVFNWIVGNQKWVVYPCIFRYEEKTTTNHFSQNFHINNSLLPAVRQRCFRHHFFPGLFFYVYIESPIPKKPRRLHTTGPKPHQLKTPTPKTQYKTPTPKPQTPNPKPP